MGELVAGGGTSGSGCSSIRVTALGLYVSLLFLNVLESPDEVVRIVTWAEGGIFPALGESPGGPSHAQELSGELEEAEPNGASIGNVTDGKADVAADGVGNKGEDEEVSVGLLHNGEESPSPPLRVTM